MKIPGFGHRVYRTEDPRATHLRVLSEELGKRTGHEKLYRLSRTMEEHRDGREAAAIRTWISTRPRRIIRWEFRWTCSRRFSP